MTVNPQTIQGAFRLFAWLFPVTPLEELTDETYEELKVIYKVRDRWTNWLGLPAFLLLSAIFYFLLSRASHWVLGDYSRAKFLIQHIRFEYALLGMFLSLASFGFVFICVLRWILGREEFALYNAYCSLRASPSALWDVFRVYRMFFVVLFPLLLVGAALLLDHYTAFTETAMVDNPAFSLGTTTVHPYDTVRGVYYVRGHHARFEDIVHPTFVATFHNGTQWQSKFVGPGAPAGVVADAMTYVAERTGNPIIPVNFIEDVPQP